MSLFSLDNSTEREAVRRLAEDGGVGYGNMMKLARDLWRELLVKNHPEAEGGEFAVGPCVAMTVPCGCKVPHKCDWCCGSGWLTERVKQAKDASKRK